MFSKQFFYDEIRVPPSGIPVVPVAPSSLKPLATGNLRAIWIGHASVYVEIDAVLISHDHYDHLDMKTIMKVATQGTQFFVPLGIGAHLEVWDGPIKRTLQAAIKEKIDLVIPRVGEIVSADQKFYSENWWENVQ